ncbi:helix-turn-helix domain-containing protein [Actinomyces israelii]|uniref:helix-turn-helix domain-containing protein n=1 Tax=Actinomyces israelii TaxID=1659 RepID=UPI00069479A0|nr:helix-turn-helix domain-containing protein [Actinomyces israelii]
MSDSTPAPASAGAPAPADARAEIKDFLTTRRAKVTPPMVGLPVVAGNRRVPGLRREEVAMLAGVSVDYYTRLERGHAGGASEEVLDALASALLLDDAERQHLFDLARSVSSTGRTRRRSRTSGAALRPGVQWLLDSMAVPALVADSLSTYVASNLMARALYSPMFLDPAPEAADQGVNMARFVFLDPRSRDFFPNWDSGAEDLVAMLRLAAGAGPADARLTALIGELSTRSREFSRLWARHDVRYVCRGEKVIRHPVVGELHLAFEPMPLTTAPGMRMTVYAVEPGSPSQDALRLLASWAATESAPAAEDSPAAPSSCT